MQTICCGCHDKISHDHARDMFAGDVPLSTEEDVEAEALTELKKRLELIRGIELITGRKIDKRNARSVGLCDACSQNVHSYLNFRARLLSSLNALKIFCELHAAASSVIDPESAGSEILQCTHEKTGQADEPIKGRSREGIDDDDDDDDDDDEDEDDDGDDDDNGDDDTVNRKTPISRSLSEDIINVDENSTPLNLDASPSFNDQDDSDERATNAKVYHRTKENFNDSDDSSNDGSGIFSPKAVFSNIEVNDIESEIDVCSGDDDEILELDSRSRRDETVEIGSSSNESDIEVCDYEPTGKRVKSYGTLSPPLLY